MKFIKDSYNDYKYYKNNKKAIKELLTNTKDTTGLYRRLLLESCNSKLTILELFSNNQIYCHERKISSLKALRRDLQILQTEDYYSINKKFPLNMYKNSYISYTIETMLNIIRFNHSLYDLDTLKYENDKLSFTIDTVINIVDLNNIIEQTKKSLISHNGKITPFTINKIPHCIGNKLYFEIQLELKGDYEIFLKFMEALNYNIKIYTEELLLKYYKLTNKDMDKLNKIIDIYNNYIKGLQLINPSYDDKDSCMFNLLDNILKTKMKDINEKDMVNYYYLRHIVSNTATHNWDIDTTFN